MKRGVKITLIVLVCILFIVTLVMIGKESRQREQQAFDSQVEIKNKKGQEQNIPLDASKQEFPSNNSPPSSSKQMIKENEGCIGTGAVNFSHSPRKMEDIDSIQPLGLMIAGHVTPIDHQYWNQPNWKPIEQLTPAELVDVFVPADGVITTIGRMPSSSNDQKDPSFGDYRIVIHHTCTFYTIYIHIYQLSPKFQQVLEDFEARKSWKGVRVKAGELIGKASNFDFSVHNEEITLSGFINPVSYSGESWKIHTVDPFDYFPEPLKSQLQTKVLRSVPPLGGKIDHDIDGKIIGNWFVENTGGYLGKSSGSTEYWSTHLAIAPDGNDPEHIVASLGDFEGKARQFGVKGNTPNPAEVEVSSGLIKYELVTADYYGENGQRWDHLNYIKGIKVKNNDEDIHGTLLVQLIENRKLKAEVFPGKRAIEISGFTANAKIYER